MVDPYNPLDKVNLGKSVADALLESRAEPLSALKEFAGAGIYVIYYCGDHPAYTRLSKANAETCVLPIYVGKAVPSGGRKGLAIFSGRIGGMYLYRRLQDHADSVRRAENLSIEDFSVRWLTVDDIWIPLGETLIIENSSRSGTGFSTDSEITILGLDATMDFARCGIPCIRAAYGRKNVRCVLKQPRNWRGKLNSF